MLTSLECMAKAKEMDARACGCSHPGDKAAMTEMADEWRRTALMARQQEAWAELHPKV